jgi:predicted ATPase
MSRREAQATQEWAEKTLALCTEQGFALILAGAAVLQGWALTEQGRGEEEIAKMRQGLAAWRATGAETSQPLYFALLAEAYENTRQAEEGLNVIAEALKLVEKTGERRFEAELYRLKGELTLQWENKEQRTGSTEQKSKNPNSQSQILDPRSEAEACFLKAIEVARRQQAKSLELRASVSLARLWRAQGKRSEAHHTLSEVYNWFTEGFDTKDLQEAKTLIEELSH